MGKLSNKVAVITGGNKGIGLAAAQLFAAEGAKVVICARNLADLNVAKETIPQEVLALQVDVSKMKDLEKMYQEIHNKYGKIDIVFANAGVAKRVWIGDVSEEVFDEIVDINFKGVYFTVQKSLPFLNKGASIILNASIAGMIAFDHHSIYSSAKAAVIQLGKTFAADLAQQSIRVNVVSPGYIKTPIWDQWFDLNPGEYEEWCKDVPFEKRFGTSEELAKTVLFLASDDSSYITAQNIVVDGGVSTIFLDKEI